MRSVCRWSTDKPFERGNRAGGPVFAWGGATRAGGGGAPPATNKSRRRAEASTLLVRAQSRHCLVALGAPPPSAARCRAPGLRPVASAKGSMVKQNSHRLGIVVSAVLLIGGVVTHQRLSAQQQGASNLIDYTTDGADIER